MDTSSAPLPRAGGSLTPPRHDTTRHDMNNMTRHDSDLPVTSPWPTDHETPSQDSNILIATGAAIQNKKHRGAQDFLNMTRPRFPNPCPLRIPVPSFLPSFLSSFQKETLGRWFRVSVDGRHETPAILDLAVGGLAGRLNMCVVRGRENENE